MTGATRTPATGFIGKEHAMHRRLIALLTGAAALLAAAATGVLVTWIPIFGQRYSSAA